MVMKKQRTLKTTVWSQKLPDGLVTERVFEKPIKEGMFGSPNGKVKKVQNTNKPKLSNANDYYYAVYLDRCGQESVYMFTDTELKRAAYRASRNVEDFITKGWITDFLD